MSKKKSKKKRLGKNKLRPELIGQKADELHTEQPEPNLKRKARKKVFRLLLVLLLVLVASFLYFKPFGYRLNLKSAADYNILLITLDTTRADHLGCYGYKKARTPNLDRLASEGLRFENVYCPAPLTLPSHTSILTGLEPVKHGVRNNGYYLPEGLRTVTEYLQNLGYKTAAFVSSYSVDSRFGLDRGFETYDDTFQANMPFKTLNAERKAEDTFSCFASWLENNFKYKFFCWVHYFDPHLPYTPPSPFREEFADNPYDGEIAYMDLYIGRIIDALKEKGVLGRTIIVVAGDHGEGLGEKIEQGHGLYLYEETVRVPLIFWNKTVWPKAQAISTKVRLIDVAPTLLEMVGLSAEASLMQGKSLLPVMTGREKKDREAIIETVYPRENFGWSELVALVSGNWKYIQAPKPELYNLKNDPQERKNIVDYEKEIAETLRSRLEQLLLISGGGTFASGASQRARNEDLERLRSLGYVSFAPAQPGTAVIDPKSPEAVELLVMVQKAQMAEYQNDYAEAEKLYQKILEKTPDSPASYISLALAQARLKKMDQALETLKAGLKKLPDNELLLVRLGHTYLVMNRPQEAYETMTRVLEINPKNVDALTACGGLMEAAGQREEATRFYKQALALEPESKFLRMALANNLAAGGHFQEAIEIYKKLIEDFPQDQAFYQYAGIAYSYLGDYSQAIFYLRQAVAIKPTPVGYFNLAVAYEKSGDLKNAIKYFENYLEIAGNDDPRSINQARAELERLKKQVSNY
ncbi:MAG: sulfatase-like hydrolase/transferase [Candidatus Aminicenantes bacterium]|nr:sulfatase-like hydrolase/transferase [Candidatus Aminicenantes bacterium]